MLVAAVGDAVAGYVQLGPALPLESSRHVLEIRASPSIRRTRAMASGAS